MAYALDADSFLSALFRFEQRRGTPAAYWSDNGTNFIGAQREISDCLTALDQRKVTEVLATRRVAWNWIPPSAPHMGGAWESLIKSAKGALRAILHRKTLTDEVLLTALCHVENLLNGRPLAYIRSESGDYSVLTPHHLLTGRANLNLPPDAFGDEDLTFRKRWRYAQALSHHFWRRWMREVLPTLAQRPKWTKQQEPVKVGDVALVIDANTPRGQWLLGRVVETHPGDDGIVRTVVLRSKGTTIKRPVAKLLLLCAAE